MNLPENDIVITGLAAISAAGVGTAPLMEALQRGESMLTPVPPEILGMSGYRWGRAEGFKGTDFISPLKARKLDRCSLFAVVAAGMALQDAGIVPGSLSPERIGVVLGCGFGGIANAEEFLRGYFTSGAEGLVPMLFPNIVPNASASNASIEHKIKGPNVTTIQRFCSAESAFHLAVRFLEEDRADVIVTGGVDEVFPAMLKGLQEMGQLRSFSEGFGEGAGLLVLEKGGHARGRRAPILAQVEEVRTIGRFAQGGEEQGLRLLLPAPCRPDLIALSGTTHLERRLLDSLPKVATIDTGTVVGRSLAMGGLSLVALVLSLQQGERGLQLAASPEGPYFAIDLVGGGAV